MGQFTPYSNLLLILKDHGEEVDLSNAFTVIEWTETIPQSIIVTLSSANGEFLTQGEEIQLFDRLYIEYEGVDGNIEKDVFHVRNINRKRLSGSGMELVLTCPHQSENLWKRSIELVVRERSNQDTLNQVIEQLNLNKGSSDPTVLSPTFNTTTKIGNNLSNDTNNSFYFDTKRLKNVFDEIGDIEGQPVEGGGTFQPPYIRFKSNYDHDADTGLDQVNIQAYAQGFNKNNVTQTFTNIPNVTLAHFPRGDEDENQTNILENHSDEDPERATNITLRCSQEAGDYLGDWTKYQGAQDFFIRARRWDEDTTFQIGAFVVASDGNRYEAIAESLNDEPPSSSWILRQFVIPDAFALFTAYTINNLVVKDRISWKALQSHTSSETNQPPNPEFWTRIFFAPPVDYSPETKNNAQDWINSFAGAIFADQSDGKTRAVDANCIIEDQQHPRTYVRFVGTTPTNIPAILKFGGTRIPDAFKMLVIDPTTGADLGTGIFAGNDPNGIPFAGNIAQFEDRDLDGTGTWFVFKEKETLQDQEVMDFFQGDSWVKNPCQGTLSFVDGNGLCNIGTRNANWVKGSYQLIDFLDVTAIFGDLGALLKFGQFVEDRPFECLHRIKFDTTNNRIDVGNRQILADDIDQNSAVFVKSEPRAAPSINQLHDWNKGVWLNFWATNPVSSNQVPFGGATMGEIVALSTFDFDNLNRGPDGTLKIFGPEIETRYPIQGFATWIQLITTFGSGTIVETTIDARGDYSFAIFLVDRNDKIRVIDNLTIGRTNDTIEVVGNLPGKQYKGVPGIPLFFSAAEPDSTDGFDPREFVFGGIFSKDSYDNQGRYKITGNPFFLKSEIELSIDGWRKPKPLIITNNDVPNSLPSRNIETQTVDNESIFRYPQGKNLVLGLEKIFGFKSQKFTLSTSGRFKVDLRHGDPVFVTDTEMISETTEGLPNTIRMVVDKITRTFSKTPSGPGGVEETYGVITRLYPDT